MIKLAHNELIVLLLSISTMLIISRIFAELGKRLKLPIVMGELIVGIVLGPTILGMLYPDIFNYLFPKTGNIPIALDGIFSFFIFWNSFIDFCIASNCSYFDGYEFVQNKYRNGHNCISNV